MSSSSQESSTSTSSGGGRPARCAPPRRRSGQAVRRGRGCGNPQDDRAAAMHGCGRVAAAAIASRTAAIVAGATAACRQCDHPAGGSLRARTRRQRAPCRRRRPADDQRAPSAASRPMQLPLCVTLGRSNDGDHFADDGQQVAQRRDRDRHSGCGPPAEACSSFRRVPPGHSAPAPAASSTPTIGAATAMSCAAAGCRACRARCPTCVEAAANAGPFRPRGRRNGPAPCR